MGSARDVAKKIRKSREAGGGNYIKQGKGRMIVKALKLEDMYKGLTFIAELQVERSESFPDAKEIDKTTGKFTDKPELANAPGTSPSFLCQLEEHEQTAYPNMKAFIYKLLDESDESIDAAAKARIDNKQVPESWCKENGKKPVEWTGDDEFGEILESLVSKAQPTRGMFIDYETYTKPSKAGKELALVKWSTVPPVQGNEVKLIAARRAALDGQAPEASQ